MQNPLIGRRSGPDPGNLGSSPSSATRLESRLRVGQVPLKHRILVRIQALQHELQKKALQVFDDEEMQYLRKQTKIEREEHQSEMS